MSPIISGVDVVYLHSQTPELRAWFREVLGLAPGYGDEHWQEYVFPNGTRFALDFPHEPLSAVEQQPVMISFKVPDLAAAVTALQEKGVCFQPDGEGFIFDVGPTLVASFQDPSGTWHQLSQPKKG